MPNYVYWCEKCEHVTDAQYRMSERPDTHPCEICDEQAEYRIQAPMVMRASYPDGHKRKGWDKLRESSKLNKLAANSHGETKKELVREINKLASIRKD